MARDHSSASCLNWPLVFLTWDFPRRASSKSQRAGADHAEEGEGTGADWMEEGFRRFRERVPIMKEEGKLGQGGISHGCGGSYVGKALALAGKQLCLPTQSRPAGHRTVSGCSSGCGSVNLGPHCKTTMTVPVPWAQDSCQSIS